MLSSYILSTWRFWLNEEALPYLVHSPYYPRLGTGTRQEGKDKKKTKLNTFQFYKAEVFKET